MRFAPRNKEVSSPRRRRPGSIGHGPYMPPVLARLPEIEPEDAAVEEESHFIDGEGGKKFRIDGAQPSPGQSAPDTPVAPVPESPVAPETPVAEPTTAMAHGEILAAAPYPAEVPAAIDSLNTANQFVSAGTTSGPKLPPLPTAGFSDTAARIMAQLEGGEVAANDMVAAPTVEHPEPNSTATSAESYKSPTGDSIADYVSPALADRNIRIDPGIPKPVAHGSKTTDAELAQKRRIARGQAPPELDVLDSPWHDWIVKLGGTFIAGLLLIAAFQAIQPKSPIEHAGADPQMETGQPTSPELIDDRFASSPVAQEPGAFDAVLDVVAPPAEPTGDPVFIDPEELDGLATDANKVADQPGYEPVEIATTNPEPSTTSMPSLDELAGDLMPAPAVNIAEDTILPMPSDDGELKPEVAAVIENDLVSPNNSTAPDDNTPAMVENSLVGPKSTNSLFGPPSTERTAQSDPTDETRVAMKDNTERRDAITPIANPTPSQYPTTGYAPVTRVPTQVTPQRQPFAPPQQSFIPPQQPSFAPPQQSFNPAQRPIMPPQQVQRQRYAAPQQTRPQFNMFPQTGRAPAPVQPGVARGFTPQEPRSPMSVQLNGTIQRFSR